MTTGSLCHLCRVEAPRPGQFLCADCEAEVRGEVILDGYDPADPKSGKHHDVYADLHDLRRGK